MENLRYPTQEDVMAALEARTADDSLQGASSARFGEAVEQAVVCVHLI
jgi:hypothetical protein